jgi:hypothetical protein
MALRHAFRVVASLAFSSVVTLGAAACSSTSKGDVSATCPEDGGCTPRPVFTSGLLSTVLVTPDAVYAGDLSGAVWAADKPLREARMLAKSPSAPKGFVRTSRGLYWFTAPNATEQDRSPKGSLTWVPSDGTATVVIDAALPRPRGIAAIGETVYVAVADGIVEVGGGETHVRRTLDVEAYALRSHGNALYWHDGLDTISTWRPGDAKPQAIVERADLTALTGGEISYEEPPFVVDDSGIYWPQQLVGGGELAHAPLAGGPVEKVLKLVGFVRSIALDDDHVYWTEADSALAPDKPTKIQRSPKSALASPVTVASIVGDSRGMQAAPEGLYIEASPSVTDFDFEKRGFKSYGGPLLILPRAMLDAKP